MEKFEKIKQRLDTVSPSFCLAKWQQVTIHLQNGHTHSCHHPQTHKVPLAEIEKDPSALHNTLYKKQQRKLMLEGKRPDECGYCWKVEDTEGEHYSDRVKKSSNSTWAEPYFDKVSTSKWDKSINPAQIEVSFGNVCNMKCVYCSPVFSSEWWSEVKNHGAYPTQDSYNNLEWIAETDRTPYLNREDNPYVEAWWKWWPEAKQDLKVLRITGGEPFLNKNTAKLIKDIESNPLPEMRLEINTNLSLSADIITNNVLRLKQLKESGKVKDVMIYTSCDCYGKQAEYIREGMDYDKWYSNCKTVVKSGISLHIMVTANLLSIDTMYELMTDIYALKRDYDGVTYGVSILHSPSFLNLLVLPKDRFWEKKLADVFEYVSGSEYTGVNEFNYVQRLVNYYNKNKLDTVELEKRISDCKNFVQEIDRRRNKNFTNTFSNYNFLTT